MQFAAALAQLVQAKKKGTRWPLGTKSESVVVAACGGVRWVPTGMTKYHLGTCSVQSLTGVTAYVLFDAHANLQSNEDRQKARVVNIQLLLCAAAAALQAACVRKLKDPHPVFVQKCPTLDVTPSNGVAAASLCMCVGGVGWGAGGGGQLQG